MDEPTEEKPNRSGAVAWVVMAALMIYLLSVGPAVKFSSAYPSLQRPLGWVYRPLDLLYGKSPAARKPIDAYLKLWGVK